MTPHSIENMVEAINEHYENTGSEIRYWIEGDYYFICYNALSDMDDIDEIPLSYIERKYKEIRGEL